MGTWLTEARRAAAEQSTTLAVPTIASEHWRFTNLRGIDFAAFAPALAPTPAATTADVAGAILLTGAEGGRVVQRDGSVVHATLDPAIAAQGVTLCSLEEAAVTHAALVERHLGSIVTGSEKFAVENAAVWSGGVFLHVPRGVRVEQPLHAAFEIATTGAAQQWRVLVVLEEGAEATFVEEHVRGVAGYANGVVELVVADAARLHYVTVQNRSVDTLHFATHRAEVQRDANLEWVSVALGGKTGKTRLESRMAGAGSSVRLTGTAVVDGTQHVDLDTTQEHDAPHATSDLFFKGVLRDRGRSVWRGVIRVAKDAQKTDAYQQNRSLILSEKAHADSIPGLEIEANDVRCTHGATISRVDQELLHYLRSRGLDRDTAERLIVQGFFADVLERITDARLREAIATALQARLG
jgi:Fe-S cluster assembly protein SufD